MNDSAVLVGATARHTYGHEPIITFPTTGGGSWKVWYRFLALREESVFEIGNVCGTCEFWFRRLHADQPPVDIPELQERLTAGLGKLDPVVLSVFERLLQSGTYRIALLQLVPQLVQPGSSDDYFENEQRSTWLDRDTEPSNQPGIDYYRVEGRSGFALNQDRDLVFEFIAPLQDSQSLDEARVAHFEQRLRDGGTPTAVAVGVLDVKQYYDSAIAHWCLTHYLLDGHHKVAAAARASLPLTLLTFIASEQGTSSPEQVDEVLASYPAAVAA